MDNFEFANRTGWELGENTITHTVQALKDDNAPLLDLTQSNPTCCQLKYPQRAILKAFKRADNLNYRPDASGLEGARRAVQDYFKDLGFSLDAQTVFLTASTSEAYSYLFRLLANPHDSILFPQPSYPLFSFLGDLHDVHLKYYQLTYEGRWQIDFTSLEEQIDSTTKAICLVNPNNPTGSYVTREELRRLEEMCQKYHLVLICDEVFWEFNLDHKEHVSLLESTTVPTCVLGGLSKTLGLPQMKLSWLILQGPEEWKKEARLRLEVIADTYLSVNTPTQNALESWLKIADQIQKPLQKRIQDNLSFLQKEMTQIQSCELLHVEGGWYVILKVPPVRSEEAWVLKLLTRYHVLVHPGYFYDFTDGPYLVISLLPHQDTFQEGMSRLLARIEQQGVNA